MGILRNWAPILSLGFPGGFPTFNNNNKKRGV
jgi:hypothetical protein